jgi:predicted nicotinamide N-methyase
VTTATTVASDNHHHHHHHHRLEDEDYFADVGFLFEANTPVRLERFTWTIPSASHGTATAITTTPVDDDDDDDDKEEEEQQRQRRDHSGVETTTSIFHKITVALHVADENPGALQSGHYLWPAAMDLAEYIVNHPNLSTFPLKTSTTTTEEDPMMMMMQRMVPTPNVTSVLELGAGCALVSMTALQLWRKTLRLVIVTDHDPSVLARARDNLETTLQTIFDENENDDDERLNAIINSVASIPVLFESLEWGDAQAMERVQREWQQHEVDLDRVDLILGSDLIYDPNVVEPLFQTAVQLGKRFVLSQSFRYDSNTEQEIDRMCHKLKLQRTILYEPQTKDDDISKGSGSPLRRIQEFSSIVEEPKVVIADEDGSGAAGDINEQN